MKNMTQTLAAALATTAVATASHAATLSIGTTAPEAADLIASNTTFNSFTRAFSDGPTGIGFDQTRGQSFKTTGLSTDTFNATSFTVRKNGAQTFNASSSLTIWVGEYVGGNGNPGWSRTGTNGHGDGNPFSSTNLTPLVSGETVSIASQAFSGGEYLTFDFDSPIELSGDTDYFFLIGFQGLSGSNDYIQLGRGDGYSEGTMLFTNDAANSVLGQDMTFWVSVPEPGSLALLGLGGLMMLKRRRQ